VGFTGFIPEPAEAMRSLAIGVHASTEPEPFGMVIVEAMACEKVVVASQAGGAAELFTDGENALGHVPGDAASLARQIRKLVLDPALRLRLGRAARQTSQLYQRARLAEELRAVYRSVSGIPTASPTGAPAETFAGAASNQ
jgi:glycosyltransferase involved in cell wall biosynthesis